MKEVRNLICIGCPMGCPLRVTIGQEDITVEGNTCPRGDAYARKEVTNPTRTVTTTVTVTGSQTEAVTVPCRTATDIPKDKILDVIAAAAALTVTAPIHIGDILKTNAGGTGIPLIATKEVR